MRSRSLILLVALVLGVISGCSHKASPHRVTLTWKPPIATRGPSATGYNVYRSAISGEGYVKIADRVPFPWYEDRAVSSGQTYFYVVTALDAAGNESRFSAETKAVIP
jgi:fibronectin type 3 domain-containing protein